MCYVSVMGSARRLCSKSDLTICTPSPAYEFSNELFICSEDLKVLFPKITEESRQKLQKKHQHNAIECNRMKNVFWVVSDTCCCVNYFGCCNFEDILCCLFMAGSVNQTI